MKVDLVDKIYPEIHSSTCKACKSDVAQASSRKLHFSRLATHLTHWLKYSFAITKNMLY